MRCRTIGISIKSLVSHSFPSYYTNSSEHWTSINFQRWTFFVPLRRYWHNIHCKYTLFLFIKFSLSLRSKTRKKKKKKCNWNAIACVVNTTYHVTGFWFCFCHWKTFRCFFCLSSSSNAYFFPLWFRLLLVLLLLWFFASFFSHYLNCQFYFFLICLDRFFFLHRSHRTTWYVYSVYIWTLFTFFFLSEQRIVCSFFFRFVSYVSPVLELDRFFLLFLLVYGLFRFFTQFFLFELSCVLRVSTIY